MKTTFVLLITALIASCMTSKNPSGIDNASIIDQLRSGANVIIKGQTIDESLDLNQLLGPNESSADIRGELRLVDCIIKQPMTFKGENGRYIRFLDDVIFENCTFESSFVINDAVFDAKCQIGDCVFQESLDLQRNTYRFRLRIESCQIGNDLIMQYSRSYGDVHVFNNKAGRHFLLQGLSVFGKTQLGNSEIGGSLDISKSHFHEDFMANYLKCEKKVLAGKAFFHGDFALHSYKVNGEIDLKESTFMGEKGISTKE